LKNKGSNDNDSYGGIYCYISTVNVKNTTIASNWGKNNCNGIVLNFANKVDISNSIVWNNQASNIYVYSENQNQLITTYSDIGQLVNGIGNINADPLFVDIVNSNYHLSTTSPCIDAGNPQSDYSKEPQPNGCRINWALMATQHKQLHHNLLYNAIQLGQAQ